MHHCWYLHRMRSHLPNRTKAVEQTDEGDSLEQLFKKKYSSRQQATLQMWRQRESSRDQVQEAARHPDPEVSQRAKWILRQWRRGSLPDTPPEISRLLQRGDGPAAVQRLLEGGQFTATVVAIEESAGAIDRERIEERVVSASETALSHLRSSCLAE